MALNGTELECAGEELRPDGTCAKCERINARIDAASFRHFVLAIGDAVAAHTAEIKRLKAMYLELLRAADRHVPIKAMPYSADEARDWS